MWPELSKVSLEELPGAAPATKLTPAPAQVAALAMPAVSAAAMSIPTAPGPVRKASFTAVGNSKAAADAARASGYARGYAAGYSAGQDRANAELEALRAAVEEQAMVAAANARAQYDAALRALEVAAAGVASRDELELSDLAETLTELALQIAQAVLGAEVTDTGKRASAALRRALVDTESVQVKSIRMYPADVAALQAGGVEIPVELIPDPLMAPGSALTELPAGFIDARLETALERVREALSTASEEPIA